MDSVLNEGTQQNTECRTCRGTGFPGYSDDACPDCHGTGTSQGLTERAALEAELAELKAADAVTPPWADTVGTRAARGERIRAIVAKLRVLGAAKIGDMRSSGAAEHPGEAETLRDTYLASPAEPPPAPKVPALADLAAKFNEVATALETAETLPRPVDLYYPIKHDFGWQYRVAGLTVSDLRMVANALAVKTVALNRLWTLLGVTSQTAAVKKLRDLLKAKASLGEVEQRATTKFNSEPATAPGQRFAHDACYYRQRAEMFEKALRISHEQTERLYALLDAATR